MTLRHTAVGQGNVRTLTSCPGHLCSIREHANHRSYDPHPCPYQTHVNDNPEYRCQCCEVCQQNCQDDV